MANSASLLLQLVALEAYRDLVKLLRRGLDDAAGIRAALEENIEARAQAKTDAAAAAGVPVSNTKPASSAPAGASLAPHTHPSTVFSCD